MGQGHHAGAHGLHKKRGEPWAFLFLIFALLLLWITSNLLFFTGKYLAVLYNSKPQNCEYLGASWLGCSPTLSFMLVSINHHGIMAATVGVHFHPPLGRTVLAYFCLISDWNPHPRVLSSALVKFTPVPQCDSGYLSIYLPCQSLSIKLSISVLHLLTHDSVWSPAFPKYSWRSAQQSVLVTHKTQHQ